ncbi:YolD-like family protein [Lederbergia sp. NSJ-179]|uniref:YolD-like family protein n=1 Tax=Lederbergia sp. NSJ-179 TaxID=2931402 RepID=UPI001FD1E021|nr:YolD-like family protein [Lederbergia sp. NSJ-179]MCJ7840616.1 YolD-like family protein [Lederbergia sp. NSJ-179]
MLPEHVKLLKAAIDKDKEMKKPIIDEHQLEEMNLTIQYAVKNNLLVQIQYYSHNTIYETEGFIKKIDLLQKILFIYNNEDALLTLELIDIINVSIE